MDGAGDVTFSATGQSPQRQQSRPEPRRTNRACVECTRRKIKCDGTLPCQNCRKHSLESRCSYRKRQRRTNPSWKTIDQLNEALNARNQIIKQLLPAVDFDSLPGLSRENVIRLISNEVDPQTPSPAADSGVANEVAEASQSLNDVAAEEEWNEAQNEEGSEPPVGDVVNGLTVHQRPGSYSRISSTGAFLHVLFNACPPAKQKFLDLGKSAFQKPKQLVIRGPSKEPPQAAQNVSPVSSTLSSLSSAQQIAVDAYFEQIHALIPMVDEGRFRDEFSSQERTDDGWKALSSMVLALGSIAAGDDQSHFAYHERARNVLGYNIFTSGNLEMLQALVLLSALYLYYINSPNTAFLVMGTAFRMAIAIGLHREPARTTKLGLTPEEEGLALSRAEVRRRTWWCLIAGNAWQGLLLHRPRVGRWDPLTMDTAWPSTTLSSISARPEAGARQRHNESEDRDWHGIALRVTAEFCIIAQRIGDRMAQLSYITPREIFAFSDELEIWSKSHHFRFLSENTCPKRFELNRETMMYRFLGVRVLLSRPHLLRLADDGMAHDAFTDDDWKVVSLCQNSASEVIDLICSGLHHDRVSVWQSTFALFQACLIPLISIAVAKKLNLFGDAAVSEWKQSLDGALRAFKDMNPHTRPADRYGSIIEALRDGVVSWNDQDSQHAADIDQYTEFLANVRSEGAMDLMNFDGQDITAPGPFLEWFNYDLAFGDQELNWYPLPDP
ncbi:uncharacterized protein PV07_06017 [Cladophialophora immunda]|uniref:Zn(2)-C6 fungal-type domain-containing protein n=1 Tax=Cladophialophora immunda TaxID=569365 RepID=A0A0D1ZQF7_9EURO|nr:uncharacterized protein PV07_06017 [Cladophialophora immunda]KIW30261.1 hypothetical protein PV07_06017 [Cladophialophora immunda]OQU95752.1 Fungal specific transcription factor domain-containing protein [Cladophialophora immunda]